MATDPPAPGNSESNVVKLAASQYEKARKNKPPPPTSGDDDRPIIELTRGSMPNIADAAEEALAKGDRLVFNLSGRLGWLDRSAITKSNGVERPPGAILFREMVSANLLDRLPKVACFKKWDAREKEFVSADVPRSLPEVILARRDDWPNIPKLHGFVEAPTLRADGSLLDTIGYDAKSFLFLIGPPIPGYEPPAESFLHAKDALERIEDAISGLPFDGKENKSAAVSAILTALVRRTLPTAPMISISAPAAGTGKSRLADVISFIATGRRAAVITLGQDENEGDKRLSSALLAGDTIIQLDNIERPMFGDLVCQVITQPMLRIRPLGASAMISTPTNTLLIATGNNLDIRGDLRRRVMLIRLDAGVERPELRRFDRELLDDISADRGALVRDALTIIRSYLREAPATVDIRPFGGFELWSKWCREPLVWLGRPDPLSASEVLREQDPDLATQRQLFSAWSAQFGSTIVTVADIIKAANEDTNKELHAAVDAVCQERISPRRLSSWLRRHKGRILDNLRLDQAGLDTSSRLMRWTLIETKLS